MLNGYPPEYAVFLGRHGFLNHVNHTSNGLDYLKQFAGVNYTGENLYMDELAVRAGNIGVWEDPEVG